MRSSAMVVIPGLNVMLANQPAVLRMILDHGPHISPSWVLEMPDGSCHTATPGEIRFPKMISGSNVPPNTAFNMVKRPTPSKSASLQIIHRMGKWLDRFREARAGDSAYSRVFRDLCGDNEQLFADIFRELVFDPIHIAELVSDVSERRPALEELRHQMGNLLDYYRRSPDAFGCTVFVEAIGKWKSICEAVTSPTIIPVNTTKNAA